MSIARLAGALALAGVSIPSVAFADDPNDPKMRNRAAREADAAEIRRLNREQLDYVRKRDSQYAEGWRQYRDYPAAQEDYRRRMDAWRRAVRMCESGHHEYCSR